MSTTTSDDTGKCKKKEDSMSLLPMANPLDFAEIMTPLLTPVPVSALVPRAFA